MNNEKVERKLKTMEICFEQINNSRNDLIGQLTNTETIIEKVTMLWLTKPAHWVEDLYEVLKK